jgi:hypothetical protein
MSLRTRGKQRLEEKMGRCGKGRGERMRGMELGLFLIWQRLVFFNAYLCK